MHHPLRLNGASILLFKNLSLSIVALFLFVTTQFHQCYHLPSVIEVVDKESWSVQGMESTSSSSMASSHTCNAEQIIRKSYEKHYKPLVDFCTNSFGNETLKSCFSEFIKPGNQFLDKSWWLHSLVERSIRRNGLFGPWHELWFNETNVRLCSIEKVATSQWQSIHIQLNDPLNRSKTYGWKQHNNINSSYAVWTRDPLERFLSAYMNKCRNALLEKNCEPRILYHNPQLNLLPKMSKRHHFESFVAAVPFGWNLHFEPQAFYCNGLFRTLNTYEFVGSMDSEHFVKDLQRFQARYPGELAQQVQKAFYLDRNHTEFRTALEETRNVHFTNAPKHVQEYYTADTIRQVIDYVSIDYVTLNLKVPDWARALIEQDCKARN